MIDAAQTILGMSAITGKTLTGTEHIKQSVNDILTTVIGSRVMRRTYGSHLFDLIDSAMNAAGILRLKAAIADAILRWEPRIKLKRVTIESSFNGKTVIGIEGRTYLGQFSFDLIIGVNA